MEQKIEFGAYFRYAFLCRVCVEMAFKWHQEKQTGPLDCGLGVRECARESTDLSLLIWLHHRMCNIKTASNELLAGISHCAQKCACYLHFDAAAAAHIENTWSPMWIACFIFSLLHHRKQLGFFLSIFFHRVSHFVLFVFHIGKPISTK